MNENSYFSIDGINRKPWYTRATYLSLIQKNKIKLKNICVVQKFFVPLQPQYALILNNRY